MNGDATVATDLYGLGATLFALLNGGPAFAGEPGEEIVVTVARILRDPVPDLRARGVPGALAEVVERLMAKEPGDRPTSAADTAALLQAVQRATGRSVTRPVIEGARTAHLPKAAPASAPRRRRPRSPRSEVRRLGGDHHDAARPALRPARLVAARRRVATRRTGARRRRALGARARPARRRARVGAATAPRRPTGRRPATRIRRGPPRTVPRNRRRGRPPRPTGRRPPAPMRRRRGRRRRPAGAPPRRPGLADRRRRGRAGGRRRARHDVRAARPHVPARPGRPHPDSDGRRHHAPAADVRRHRGGRGRPRHHAPCDRRRRHRARRLRHGHQRAPLLRLVRAAEPGQPDREEGRAGLDRRRVEHPDPRRPPPVGERRPDRHGECRDDVHQHPERRARPERADLLAVGPRLHDGRPRPRLAHPPRRQPQRPRRLSRSRRLR